MTINDTWGFKQQDTDWKTSTSLIRTLVETASGGGNLLLNIGPDGYGAIPGGSQQVLLAMGNWLKANGESIYGTHGSCFSTQPAWGWVTTRTGRLYAHILTPPADGALLIPALVNQVRVVRSLANPAVTFPFQTTTYGIEVALPAVIPDSTDYVLVLEFDGDPVAET
jgi:alpha-L-fucosidase